LKQHSAIDSGYSSAHATAVVLSVLIDNYDAQQFVIPLERLCKEACAYRQKGSDEFWKEPDILCATKTLHRTKGILIRKYGDLRCVELSAWSKQNIDRHRIQIYAACGRTQAKGDQQKFGRPANNNRCNKAAYRAEKEKQNASSAARTKQHHVYYVQWDNDLDYVKIGYSSAPEGRLTGFLTSSPRKLRLLRLEPVMFAQEESKRHNQFNEHWHRREWFRYEGALRQYIQSLSPAPAIELWNKFSPAAQSEIEVEYF
jgi:hypothetical protein